jgi:molybdenum cofactor cytidylyltransferase
LSIPPAHASGIVAALLAAGAGTRFGGGKLEADLNGTMLGLIAAQTLVGMGFGRCVAVVNPASMRLSDALRALGFDLIENPEPEKGLSQSVALAAQAALDSSAEAMLICLADMPLVTPNHLAKLVQSYETTGRVRAVASANDGIAMPPALFPKALWPDLATAEVDQGGRALLGSALLVDGDATMLADVDTRDALSQMSRS